MPEILDDVVAADGTEENEPGASLVVYVRRGLTNVPKPGLRIDKPRFSKGYLSIPAEIAAKMGYTKAGKNRLYAICLDMDKAEFYIGRSLRRFFTEEEFQAVKSKYGHADSDDDTADKDMMNRAAFLESGLMRCFIKNAFPPGRRRSTFEKVQGYLLDYELRERGEDGLYNILSIDISVGINEHTVRAAQAHAQDEEEEEITI